MSNAQSQRTAVVLSIIKTLSIVPFSVFYSSLILYLTHQLHFSDKAAALLVSSSLGYLFLLRIAGGYLGTYLVNHRNLILAGLLAITLASLFFSSSTQGLFYPGLALFVVGNAFLVSINCLLSELYEYDDIKRENAFILNYSSINVGYIVGFALSGYYQLTTRYNQLFFYSSFFSFAALLLILFNWQNIKSKLVNNHEDYGLGYGVILALFPIVWLILLYTSFSNNLLLLINLLILLIVVTYSFRKKQIVKIKIYNGIMLAVITLLFWTFNHLTPLTLMLFIERNVDRHLIGFTISPQWLQIVSALSIMIGGPLFYFLFKSFKRNKSLNRTYNQFASALLLLGVSFLLIYIGIYFSNNQGLTNINWIICSLAAQGLSELLIAPIGFALIVKLTNNKLHGMLMGLWMTLIGTGAILAGYLSKLILVIPSSNPYITNTNYQKAFLMIGLTVVMLSCLIYLLPPIYKFYNLKRK